MAAKKKTAKKTGKKKELILDEQPKEIAKEQELILDNELTESEKEIVKEEPQLLLEKKGPDPALRRALKQNYSTRTLKARGWI